MKPWKEIANWAVLKEGENKQWRIQAEARAIPSKKRKKKKKNVDQSEWTTSWKEILVKIDGLTENQNVKKPIGHERVDR